MKVFEKDTRSAVNSILLPVHFGGRLLYLFMVELSCALFYIATISTLLSAGDFFLSVIISGFSNASK